MLILGGIFMRYNPYQLFENDLFENTYSRSDVLKTDIHEKDGYYILNIEVPGFKKEDIRIELKEGTLKISASRNIEKNLEGKIIRQERFSGTYSRSFYVGEAIIPQDIKASFDNGELIITLPTEKQKEKQGRHFINIE